VSCRSSICSERCALSAAAPPSATTAQSAGPRIPVRLSTAAGDPATGILKTYLYGNDWVFPAGDKIVLQVTQNDSPYLRPDNEPSAIDWSGLTLDIPTHVS